VTDSLRDRTHLVADLDVAIERARDHVRAAAGTS